MSEELVLLLKDKDIALKDKYAAIRTDTNLVTMALRLGLFLDESETLSDRLALAIKDSSEAFNLVLELVDINTSAPHLIDIVAISIICKREGLLKKIIDAGFDFFAHTEEILDGLQRVTNNDIGTFSQEFFDKMAAYAAEKLAHKN